MKRTVLVAAVAALALTSPALAGWQRHCTHSRFFGTTCTEREIADPRPMTEAEIAARKAEDEKWFAFCKPVRDPDALGVIRLLYAHEGCEFGRSE